ncbi:MAG TPA: peptide deformylase, partial [Jatrophihabitans sp.]|nr:peptide deformylase [Jatrophihabitans sp.]
MPDAPKIRVVGDPVLHATAREVTEFDDSLAQLIDEMFASLEVAGGVGLAAPQIGVPLAVFV